jgi:hypothetical protein
MEKLVAQVFGALLFHALWGKKKTPPDFSDGAF